MQQLPADPIRAPHGAMYWTLFVLFFPVTIPYALVRWSILTIRNAPARPPRPRKQGPSLVTRMNRLSRGMRRVNRTMSAGRAFDRRNRKRLGTRK